MSIFDNGIQLIIPRWGLFEWEKGVWEKSCFSHCTECFSHRGQDVYIDSADLLRHGRRSDDEYNKNRPSASWVPSRPNHLVEINTELPLRWVLAIIFMDTGCILHFIASQSEKNVLKKQIFHASGHTTIWLYSLFCSPSSELNAILSHHH